MPLDKLCRQIMFLLDQLVFQKKAQASRQAFWYKSHSSGLKQKLKTNWEKWLRIWLEMLLVPVEERSNFLGIAFHICKHFQKCKCYINRYEALDFAFLHISVNPSLKTWLEKMTITFTRVIYYHWEVEDWGVSTYFNSSWAILSCIFSPLLLSSAIILSASLCSSGILFSRVSSWVLRVLFSFIASSFAAAGGQKIFM